MVGAGAWQPNASSLSVLPCDATLKVYWSAAARQDIKARPQLAATDTKDYR